ncbi:unnamed protein product [Aphanomyces euteiches]|uniref:Uncharacterized protein n=1 Tax=Aphanomyces euteiches TaxID=100861 RepID=A0A6G0WZX7_9STRA|nr:hypothetical protein Ae201684_009982 [Aphanomyces euteiches]KAH9095934.1 hypothetical protein Ae201684P_010143 [Aphanomyces euteiches]KAH9156839.1 hypothetical protein AeRB84_001290 [Aphanomyces euteiches]
MSSTTALASSLSKFGPLKKSTVLLLLENEHLVSQVYKIAEERGTISDADVLAIIAKGSRVESQAPIANNSNGANKFASLKTSTKLLLFDNEHVLAQVYEEANLYGSISDARVLDIIRQQAGP